MKTHLALLVFVSVGCYAANDKATCVRGLPPSPFKMTASARVPKPDRVLHTIEQRLDLNAVSTNQSELRLRSEIKELKSKLDNLEAAAYAKDPLLRLFGQYEGQAHDWVIKHHLGELNAADRFYRSGAQRDGNLRNQSRQRLNDLINMAVFKELATNTNFAQLLKAGFEPALRLVGTSYARQDVLLGFHSTTPPVSLTNFEAYIAELDKRYDMVKAKVEEIQLAEAIPGDVIAGLAYRNVYGILDGCADTYVQLRTPDELTKLREQLRRKYNEMQRLRVRSAPV